LWAWRIKPLWAITVAARGVKSWVAFRAARRTLFFAEAASGLNLATALEFFLTATAVILFTLALFSSFALAGIDLRTRHTLACILLGGFACFVLTLAGIKKGRLAGVLLTVGQGPQNHPACWALLQCWLQRHGLWRLDLYGRRAHILAAASTWSAGLPAFNNLNRHSLGPAMGEALAHGSGTSIGRFLEGQRRFPYNAQGLVAGCVIVSHPVRRPTALVSIIWQVSVGHSGFPTPISRLMRVCYPHPALT
jgi:hypothetical protein